MKKVLMNAVAIVAMAGATSEAMAQEGVSLSLTDRTILKVNVTILPAYYCPTLLYQI